MPGTPPSTIPVTKRADLVRIVEYVSECDVRALTPPITKEFALDILRVTRNDLDKLDLVCEGTGRFVSWSL
jgi:hypothetical protein